MHYFEGFGFYGTTSLFTPWVKEGECSVAGFSYGAQSALEYVMQAKRRIQYLQLISPAFFNDKEDAFMQAQLKAFEKNQAAYMKRFYANAAYPANVAAFSPYIDKSVDVASLKALLSYRWEPQKLEALKQKGVVVEVFIGGKDKIVDAGAACDFFAQSALCYYFKEAGHLLRSKDDGI